MTFLPGGSLMVDEDVCEGCCRIANVRFSSECVQNLSNEAVDGFGLVFLVGRSILVEQLLASVNGCVVGLVVDHQKWKFGDNLPAIFRRVEHTVLNPAQKGGEYRFLLLDHKEPRSLFWRNAMEMFGDGLVKVAVVRTRGRGVRL